VFLSGITKTWNHLDQARPFLCTLPLVGPRSLNKCLSSYGIKISRPFSLRCDSLKESSYSTSPSSSTFTTMLIVIFRGGGARPAGGSQWWQGAVLNQPAVSRLDSLVNTATTWGGWEWLVSAPVLVMEAFSSVPNVVRVSHALLHSRLVNSLLV
jgi:hypothetical protein